MTNRCLDASCRCHIPIAPSSERDDFVPTYVEFTIKTDKQFLAKYGLLARFKCQTCGHEWEEKPGFVFCPRDQYHDYITWTNYNEVSKKMRQNETTQN